MKSVNEATDYAENAPYSVPEDAMKYVYAEGNE
jgi:2-oxoisovalerate dehydrogenase E1 component alpha subunit